MRAATSALPFVLGISVVACNAITGIGDLERGTGSSTGNPDGGPCGGADLTSDANNCGTCGHACGATNYCAASACIQGCTGGLLYVSPTGDNSATGCTQAAPLQTLTHALALGKQQGNALVQEIHACKGTYKEAGLTLDFKASLRGGYDCKTWNRTATFGYPTFDTTSATEIDSSAAATAAGETTLLVGGAAVDHSVVVDGWTIRGSSAASTTIALGLIGGAALIEDDQILGGSPNEASSPNASIGVQISASGAAEITSCKIDGGGGVSTSTSGSAIGSIGILVAADSGNPNVHDNVIGGGSGTAPSGDGSVGMSLSGGTFSGATSIHGNTIGGGTGKVTKSGAASVGIASVTSGIVELDNNNIDGGTGSCAAATSLCENAGIVAGVGTLVAHANKIYGGDATGGSSIGISVSGLKSFTAENNMIHGGNKGADATHRSASGIEITQTAGPTLINNTIYSGSAGTGSHAAGILIAQAVSGLVAENNLFATSGTNDSGLTISCTPSLVATFENNVFLDPTDVIDYGSGGPGTCPSVDESYATITDAETFLKATNTGSPQVQGNMRFALSCLGDVTASCTINAMCNSAAACAAEIFTSWSAADTGYSVLESTGWKINPICEVSQGGIDVTSILATDFYGSARTLKLSAGAHEQDAACTP